MFVGIDWAAESHDVCVVDPTGKIGGRASVAHSKEGFDELVKHLGRWARQGEVLVGIERPEGRLVDRILEAGYTIVLIPTYAMKDLRRRYAVGGAKSDPGDAYVIADVVRTDGHRLRRLEPLSEQTRALRSVVRARGDLVDQRVGLANQLRACLEAYWPGAAVIFSDVASEICLAFLERYPTPEAAARLGELRLQSFLKKAGYCGRRPPAELLGRLHGAPDGINGVEAEARADAVRAMVRVMRSLLRSIKDLDRAVVAHLGEHPDAEVFTSLPRSGQI
ncbi:MAG TPA: IS110 family transposase, partial [Actinomycetota bacterium]|nr:IS110 family transposase [Actinomycetota bacterium]